jgi:hypothetical protein
LGFKIKNRRGRRKSATTWLGWRLPQWRGLLWVGLWVDKMFIRWVKLRLKLLLTDLL